MYNTSTNNGQYVSDYPYQHQQQPQHQIPQQHPQQQHPQQQRPQQHPQQHPQQIPAHQNYNYQAASLPNTGVSSKFTPQDVQVLRQLLIAGEKHKWKQITKEINQSSAQNSQASQSYNTSQGSVSSASSNTSQKSSGQSKNVSPTFVMKQYQSLLGLPNSALYFGTLGSSLPYVVSANGWDSISDSSYHHQFSEDVE